MFKHLTERKIGYWKHLVQAWAVAWRMWVCYWQMIVHGLWPDVYTHAATSTCQEVLKDLHSEAQHQPDPAEIEMKNLDRGVGLGGKI
jgi:hypothetical protein